MLRDVSNNGDGPLVLYLSTTTHICPPRWLPPSGQPGAAHGTVLWRCSSPIDTAVPRSSGGEFSGAFDGADILYVTDVYPAGERPRTGVSGRLIVDAVRDAHPDQDIRYVVRREELVVQLADELEAGDLCLTMGAGDLTSVPDEVRALLEAGDRG